MGYSQLLKKKIPLDNKGSKSKTWFYIYLSAKIPFLTSKSSLLALLQLAL